MKEKGLKKVIKNGETKRAIKKKKLEEVMEKEMTKKVMEKKSCEKTIKTSCSNILLFRQKILFAKMLFELIYNLYFEASLFIIDLARNNNFSCLISTILL